jgi:hypothetical protein
MSRFWYDNVASICLVLLFEFELFFKEVGCMVALKVFGEPHYI